MVYVSAACDGHIVLFLSSNLVLLLIILKQSTDLCRNLNPGNAQKFMLRKTRWWIVGNYHDILRWVLGEGTTTILLLCQDSDHEYFVGHRSIAQKACTLTQCNSKVSAMSSMRKEGREQHTPASVLQSEDYACHMLKNGHKY